MKKIFFLFTLFFFSFTSVSLAEIYISPNSEFDSTKGVFYNYVKPGDNVKYSVIVGNNGTVDENVLLYPTDIKTGLNGGYEYKLPAEETFEVGGWFDTEIPIEFVLKPKEEKEFLLSLTVPEEIKEGQYIGGIVALRRDVKKTNESENNYVVHENKMYVLQNVLDYKSEYSIRKMEISDFNHSRYDSGLSFIEIGLINKGTILEKPKIKLNIYDSKDKEIFDGNKDLDSFYGRIHGLSNLDLSMYLAKGDYRALVTIMYGREIIEKEFNFTVSSNVKISGFEDVITGEFSIMDFIKQYIWIFVLIIILFLISIIVSFRKINRYKKKIKNLENEMNDR